MLYVLSKLLNFFTSPINWIMLLLAAGVISKKPRLRKLLVYLAIVIGLIFTNKQLAKIAIVLWSEEWNKPFEDQSVYDFAIVMGGSVNYSEKLQKVNYNEHADRITEAIRLYRTGKVKSIYFLGEAAFNYRQGKTYAPRFLNYMQQMGVDSTHILLEQHSRTTRENIDNLKKLLQSQDLGKSKILLITSGWHMRRTLKGFKNSDLNITPYAVEVPNLHGIDSWTDLLPTWEAARQWQMLIHEIIGILVI